MRRRISLAFLTVAYVLASGCSDSKAPQNAAGLGALAASAEGFTQASPDTRLTFPQDHGAHEGYRIEWWYLTANLKDDSGQPYGVQWTLFRIAQRSLNDKAGSTADRDPGDSEGESNPWQSPQVYMAHFAISTASEHNSFQRYARGGSHGGLARAGVNSEPFRAWIDDWYLGSAARQYSNSSGTQSLIAPIPASRPWLPLNVYAQQDNFSAQLSLTSDKPLVLQGDFGFSRKHPNGAGSHYYSHPFLMAEGELVIDGTPVPVSGEAWLDREWSSQFLQEDQSGWDWFALHLDSGEKLMLFRLRDAKSETANYRHAVLISPAGTKRELDQSGIHFEVLERASIGGRELPIRWRITLDQLDRELLVSTLHPQQWMNVDFPYWEGYVMARGVNSAGDQTDSPGESGRGYLEMVGYPAFAQ